MGAGLLAEDRRIRGRRPAKEAIDPWRPLGWLVEPERTPAGPVEPVLTVFLAGAECPFTCVFCDLWRHTLDVPTPPGALPRQLELAMEEAASAGPLPRRIKLYNAGNFFDRRAVPPADLGAIAALLAPFATVTVECHPRLVGASCREFAERLAGGLEVAMGLETIHPESLPRLNKRMTLADFDRAVEDLRRWGIALRAFVLLGSPFVPAEEGVAWAVRSVAYALDRGAGVVAIIPLRGGNGELERLAARGELAAPTLADLEAALDGSLALGRGVVVADLWDVERLACCPACGPARLDRLARMNATGRREPAPPRCAACAGA